MVQMQQSFRNEGVGINSQKILDGAKIGVIFESCKHLLIKLLMINDY